MTELDFDRDLRNLFDAGPRSAPSATLERALAQAGRVDQRRPRVPRLDTHAWPPPARSAADPTLQRSFRAVLVAMLVVLVAAAALAVGSRLLPPPARTELVPAGELPRSIPGPTALALPDGRILVHGQGSASIFDPRTGEGSPANLGPFREGALVLRLPDTRIVVIGPVDSSGGPTRIGVFDPTAMETTILTELPSHFGEATAVLDDGRVLLAGGVDTSADGFVPLDSVRVFDPVSGGVSEVGSMLKPRVGAAIVALDHGRVLIVGVDSSRNDSSTVEVELYDVGRGRSEAVGAFNRSEFFWPGPSVPLSDRRVLISGSQIVDRQCGDEADPRGLQYLETHQEMHLFDPATGRLTQLADIPHASAHLIPTSDGRVVLFGSYLTFPSGCLSADQPIVQPWVGVYDPRTGTTLETANPTTATATLPFTVTHQYGTGVLLSDGRVALIADDEGGPRNAVDLLTVAP